MSWQGSWCHGKGHGGMARVMINHGVMAKVIASWQGLWCHGKGHGVMARVMVSWQGSWLHGNGQGGMARVICVRRSGSIIDLPAR